MRFKWGYGKGFIDFQIDDERVLGVIESGKGKVLSDYRDAANRALDEPIKSYPLEKTVRRGDKIVVVVPDFHRAWCRCSDWIEFVIERILSAGVPKRDILIIIACGTHEKPSSEQKRIILGEKVLSEHQIEIHDCENRDNMVFLGTTRRGTPARINKKAIEADHLVLTGAVVPHVFAGFGGGRKAIVPGISAHDTIIANHKLCLGKNEGEGMSAYAKPGVLKNNPVSEDMMEIAKMVKPSFIFNVVLNETGGFLGFFAGEPEAAHQEACEFVRECFEVEIPSKAPVLIASRGGYPLDMTFYQVFQSNANAEKAVDSNGICILVGECGKGIGHHDYEKWFELGSAEAIERELRKEFTVPGFLVYRAAHMAKSLKRLIVVSSMNPDRLSKIGITGCSKMDEAMRIVDDEMPDEGIMLMPHATQTVPKLKKINGMV